MSESEKRPEESSGFSVLDILQHIDKLMHASNVASEERHNKLQASVQQLLDESHSTPCPHLRDAIPNDDYKGHGNYHLDLIEWNRRMSDLKWHITKVVGGALVTAFVLWLGFLIWVGVLHGPESTQKAVAQQQSLPK